ncbi:MAG: hypothetical protein DRJ67_09295 [Thermoprotei archaeon]|nr:hypothetical protein [Thermoproteales archaeon]RLE85193.1 MAG: hypothetical protein DRJ67_09295 [Thermoprotei archaeon]
MIVLLTVKDLVARLYFTGFHCPVTYSALRRAMPLTAMAHRLGGILLLRLELRGKAESHRATLGLGEVAYWPPADALVVSLEQLVKMPSPVNPLGVVVEGLELLRSLEECEEARAVLRLPEGEDVQWPSSQPED